MALISWDMVCKLVSQGGLGELKLHTINLALLTKWGP